MPEYRTSACYVLGFGLFNLLLSSLVEHFQWIDMEDHSVLDLCVVAYPTDMY